MHRGCAFGPVALVVGSLVGCTPSAPPAQASRPPSRFEELFRQGARFRRWTPVLARAVARGSPFERRCDVMDGVLLTRGATGVEYGEPLLCGVRLALRLATLEAILQREARRVFGRRVARIEHLGSYACRPILHLPETASQHAFGNAIDLRAFVIDDGRRVTVADDFVGKDHPVRRRNGEFLRAVEAAVRRGGDFPVLLTPHFDRRHRDHFHLEGPR